MATGVRGADDRLGRALACLSFALPVVLLFSVGPFFFTGDWDKLPAVLGLASASSSPAWAWPRWSRRATP